MAAAVGPPYHDVSFRAPAALPENEAPRPQPSAAAASTASGEGATRRDFYRAGPLRSRPRMKTFLECRPAALAKSLAKMAKALALSGVGEKGTIELVSGTTSPTLEEITIANVGEAQRGADGRWYKLVEIGAPGGLEAYRAAILTRARKGEWEKTVAMFDAMLVRGILPDPPTFAAVATAANRNGQWERALEIFDMMGPLGVTPTAATFATAIKACSKGLQLERAMDIFYSMPAKGVVPDRDCFESIISICEASKSWKAAVEASDFISNIDSVLEKLRKESSEHHVANHTSALSDDHGGRAIIYPLVKGRFDPSIVSSPQGNCF